MNGLISFLLQGRARRRALLPLILAIALPHLWADQGDIETALKRDMQDKIVILRNFYTGQELQFDSHGDLIGDAKPGYWTSDGMLQISDVGVDLRAGRLLLRGHRVINEFDHEKCQFASIVTRRAVEIFLQLDPSWQDAAAVRRIVDKVLIGDMNQLPSLVPDYWQGWLGEIKRVMRDGHSECQAADLHPMSQQPSPSAVSSSVILAHGSSSKDASNELRLLFIESDGTKVFRLSSDIKPPKPLHSTYPKYNDAARQPPYHGTSVLLLVINELGEPTTIRIVRPLGAGLDDEAVEAVKRWRFSPATYRNIPVAVQISIQINFQ